MTETVAVDVPAPAGAADPDGAVDTGRVRVADGIEIAYSRRGRGTTDVVLVNNFFMDRKSWKSYTGQLEENFRLIEYDLRGQGDSTPADGPLEWDDHINDLLGLLDALGVERAVLVGTSFSTLICRDAAIAAPDRIAGLVMAGPAMSAYGPRRIRQITKSWLKALQENGLGQLYNQLYPLVTGDAGVEEAGVTGFLGRKQNFLGIHTVESLESGLAVSLKAPNDPELLTKVQCPTLLFVGDDDFSLGTSGVAGLEELLPDSRTVVAPRGGHLAFLEQADFFQEEAVRFISGLG
ncbi:alpha/beta hydrolase [Streptomyces triticagri]|uniref:Alpha/beta hydrolase n=1 Tax=Streptomyces triticagri TaxID=2293568 RepID=A0A372M772_9ACTN|nr:alpha/beta hydrolase [Streptomyces triticagri]RFU86792.1 alpha/beta hydrolase [Streptomyces triticagri]